MRRILLATIAISFAVLAGCTPDADVGGLSTVAGITETVGTTPVSQSSSVPDTGAPQQTSSSTSADPTITRAADEPPLRLTISGTVGGNGDYELHTLNQGLLGDSWTVTASSGLTQSNLILVLFDQQSNRVRREVIAPGGALRHQLRAPSTTLSLGVAPAVGSPGGAYTVIVERSAGGLLPPARRQVVWLNFAGGTGVRVHGRSAISFGAFDAARLGSAYAGAAQQIKQIILDEMRTDYAPHDIVILSSDDGPPPGDTHAILHFGGDDSRLLGLADSVDQYNEDPGETAIIYSDAFEAFSVMQLSVEEMAQMIANTGSHELGHLLGLFHTKAPAHLMDTTGTAWDLVQDQHFGVAALEPSVFPTGFEDASTLLAQTLGPNPKPQSAKVLSTAKLVQRARIRAMIDEALPTRCGTCLDPDH